MIKENIVIIYHGDCDDGFGGAYAAWKKFGDSAVYIPAYDRTTPPVNLEGKEVYIIDFSYPKEKLLELEKKAKRLVILDHHIGAREAVETVREHVFDNDKSGTGIAWEYFHPGQALPKLLAYIQDNDLWRFALPNSKEIGDFLRVAKFDFNVWDKLVQEFEDKTKFEQYSERGKVYHEYFNSICENLAEQAELVEFESHQIFAVNAPRFFRSELGNKLARQRPPFSIIWYRHQGSLHFSLRGDDSIDLTKIAKHYGGSGHKNAAAFRLPLDAPLPFKVITTKK